MKVDRRKWNRRMVRVVAALSTAQRELATLRGLTPNAAGIYSLRDADGCIEGAIALLFQAERLLPKPWVRP